VQKSLNKNSNKFKIVFRYFTQLEDEIDFL